MSEPSSLLCIQGQAIRQAKTRKVMMMRNEDMPAMPFVIPRDVVIQPYSGLSKREDIAKFMMAALLGVDGYKNWDVMASDAIAAADALLSKFEVQECHRTKKERLASICAYLRLHLPS